MVLGALGAAAATEQLPPPPPQMVHDLLDAVLSHVVRVPGRRRSATLAPARPVHPTPAEGAQRQRSPGDHGSSCARALSFHCWEARSGRPLAPHSHLHRTACKPACSSPAVQDSVRVCSTAHPSRVNASPLQAAALSQALTACAQLRHVPLPAQLGHICSVLEAHGSALQV